MKNLKRIQKQRKLFSRDTIYDVELVMYKNKIYVPEEYRNELVIWYHENLQHRGKDLMIKTIGTNFL